MSNGLVEQISPPKELYRRPASPFVAEFIGSNTIINGTPDGTTREGLVRLSTPLGAIAGHGPATSDMAIIPAEAFRIDAAGGPGELRFDGTVTGKTLVGSVGHLRVRLADHREIEVETHADTDAARALKPGTQVTLGVDPGAVTLINS